MNMGFAGVLWRKTSQPAKSPAGSAPTSGGNRPFRRLPSGFFGLFGASSGPPTGPSRKKPLGGLPCLGACKAFSELGSQIFEQLSFGSVSKGDAPKCLVCLWVSFRTTRKGYLKGKSHPFEAFMPIPQALSPKDGDEGSSTSAGAGMP